MTRKTWRNTGMAFLMALALFGLAAGVHRAQARDNIRPSAATLGSGFTYQGQLSDGSGPVNDTCDFKFTLYDAASAGNIVGSTVTQSSIAVTNGLFTVTLDFGSSAFTGDARWLDVQVRCPAGSGSYTSLSPRQALTAAPYALSLQSGATIQYNPAGYALGLGGGNWDPNSSEGDFQIGDSTYKFKIAVATAGGGAGDVRLRAQGGTNRMMLGGGANDVLTITDSNVGIGTIFPAASNTLQVETSSSSGTAVYGYASASSGDTVGLWGHSASTTGRGVFGLNSASSGVTYGVWAQSTSTNGRGVLGYASASSGTTYGVYGISDSTSGRGVYGYAGAASGYTYGMYGQSVSSNGTAVYGYASAASGPALGVVGRVESPDGNGVSGLADATTGSPIGVYGRSNSPTGWGIYSNGNAHIEGQLTWKPITSTLSIPPAAFTPSSNSGAYIQGGYYLHPGTTLPATIFYAPVNLPPGATVTKFTFYWSDSSASDGYAILQRSDNVSSPVDMANAPTSGSAGQSSSTDTSIAYAVVDNTQYSYLIALYLPDSNVYAYNIFIEYTIDRPY